MYRGECRYVWRLAVQHNDVRYYRCKRFAKNLTVDSATHRSTSRMPVNQRVLSTWLWFSMLTAAKWWDGNLDRAPAARLLIVALEKAIAECQQRPGLVHRSARGVQYASEDYVRILSRHQMIPSMSQPANPYWNRGCKRVRLLARRHDASGASLDFTRPGRLHSLSIHRRRLI
jgi:transposase InsO family protein